MSKRVLLLGPDWRIERVIGLEEAVTLILDDAVVSASEQFVDVWHSPSTEVVIPEVVARRSGKVWPRVFTCSPRLVRRRDEDVCQFVVDGQACDSRGSTVDHLLPRSRGGPNSWENLVAACQTHNGAKKARTLDEMGWGLRRPPRKPTADLLIAGGGDMPESWLAFVRS